MLRLDFPLRFSIREFRFHFWTLIFYYVLKHLKGKFIIIFVIIFIITCRYFKKYQHGKWEKIVDLVMVLKAKAYVEQLLFVYSEFLGIFSSVVVLDIQSSSALFCFQVAALLISYFKVSIIPKNGGKGIPWQIEIHGQFQQHVYPLKLQIEMLSGQPNFLGILVLNYSEHHFGGGNSKQGNKIQKWPILRNSQTIPEQILIIFYIIIIFYSIKYNFFLQRKKSFCLI